MFREMPDFLREKVLEYLEHKDFTKAKLIYDEWHSSQGKQTLLNDTYQYPEMLRDCSAT